jgi:hypothetical protein
MGRVSAIVSTELLSKLNDLCVPYNRVDWSDDLHYVVILHPDAPEGRHVDVILDDGGLRFRPEVDV